MNYTVKEVKKEIKKGITAYIQKDENGDYCTYIGNPFNDKLSNIESSNDVRSWTSESLHTLEGGREAFYERKVIYESNGN